MCWARLSIERWGPRRKGNRSSSLKLGDGRKKKAFLSRSGGGGVVPLLVLVCFSLLFIAAPDTHMHSEAYNTGPLPSWLGLRREKALNLQ